MLATLDPDSTVSPAALVQPLALGGTAKAHVAQARNVHDLLARLSASGLYVDAARVMMRALPKRYAVAWVCECYKHDGERAPFSAGEKACLRCVESWLTDGSEPNRQAASDRAAADNYDSGAAWLAAAAGWSGGSLAPRGYAVVAPAEHLTADGCFAALCLLAAREPSAFAVRLRGWLERAIRVFGPGNAGPAGDSAAGATQR
jgi:hypothetical protein